MTRKLQIEIVQLDDFFYARSDDVPGLHVMGKSLHGLKESTLRAICILVGGNRDSYRPEVEFIENFQG
jgi:hypothetical protein